MNQKQIRKESELLQLLEQDAVQRARQSLLAFTRYTFPKYDINWHHRSLCNYLDKFARGSISRLMVFMPPRTGKSELVSRRLPAFLLGRNPDERIITASYSADLSSRMNRDVQRILQMSQFQRLFPGTRLASDPEKTSKEHFDQTSSYFEVVGRRGFYKSAGVGGGITGLGADTIIIDDPIKNKEEADSVVFRDKLWEWYASTLYSRLEKNGRILVTLTRWHEDDLAGRLLKQGKGDKTADQWEVLSYPMIAE